MSDLTITAANVAPGVGAVVQTGTSGGTITQGQSVYLDTGTNTIKLADAITSAATAVMQGVSLNSAVAGQPISYIVSGNYTVGATLSTGAVYILSGANAGGLAPVADRTTGWYPVIAFIAQSTTVGTLVLRSNNPLTASS